MADAAIEVAGEQVKVSAPGFQPLQVQADMATAMSSVVCDAFVTDEF